MKAGPGPDVPRMLGLTGPGAWAMAGVFWVTYIILIALSGGPPMETVEGWIAFLLTLATAVVVVLPGRHPLRLSVVAGVLGVVVFSTVAINAHLSPYGWPGWTSWQYGSNTFLLFMVALRGRVWWGALGMLLMMVLTVWWTWSTTGDVVHGLDLTYRQAATYLAGSFFAAWLRRTARQIVAFQEAEQRRIRDEQTRESGAAERQRETERVRRIAGPALAAIAAGDTSASARREHGLLEAQLRDGIRGRALTDDGRLSSALRETRLRGARVTVLDDLPRGGAPRAGERFLAASRDWIIDQVGRHDSGDITVRIALADAEPVVTVATADGGTETFRDDASFSPRAASARPTAPDPPG